MKKSKKGWLKDSKVRLVATVLGVIASTVATGIIFDWRAALGVLVAEVIACAAYSLRLWKNRKEGKDDE